MKLPKQILLFSNLVLFTFIFLLSSQHFSLAAYTASRFVPDSSVTNYVNFDLPMGIVTDSSENVYVVDRQNNRIQKFDQNGNLLLKWGTRGNGNGEFYLPGYIAIDSNSYLYVTDSANNRVQKFTTMGVYVTQWASNGAVGIDVDSSDNVYVVDGYNHQVNKYDSAGNLITQWGSLGSGPGELDTPWDLKIDRTHDWVYVVDRNNHRIQKYTAVGGFISNWGSYGTGDSQFQYPQGLAVDASGNVYVSEIIGVSFKEYDSTGNYISSFGSSGVGEGLFYSPAGITIASSGNIYAVSSSGSNTVQKYTSTWGFIRSWGTFGFGNNQFYYPTDLDFDSNGNLYISDLDNNYIQKFNSSGAFQANWGTTGAGQGEFSSPSGIGVSSGNVIYVADSDNNRIEKFSSTGSFISEFGGSGSGSGLFNYPVDVEVASNGTVYVLDSYNCLIQMFDGNNSDAYLGEWGSCGTGADQIDYPVKIALDPTENYLYILDDSSIIVKKFQVNGTFDSSFGVYGTNNANGEFRYPTGISVDPTGNVYVSDETLGKVQKFDSSGNFVTSFGDKLSTANASGVAFYNNKVYVMSSGDFGIISRWSAGGNQITGLVSAVDTITTGGSVKVGGPVQLDTSSVPVTIVYNGVNVSDIIVDFSLGSNLDWTPVHAGADITTGRTFVSNLNPVDAPGASSTHSLYVPKLAGQTSVYICPTATALNEVYLGCPGGYNLSEGSPSLSVVNVSGQDYWVISGLTGTGALGLSQLGTSFTLTPNNSAVSSTQEVVMSYGTTTGFAALDKVQFHFEPTAGFVLANTCATPTTDSNNDLTVDGAGAIVGSDVYEYTFSDTVTGPSTVSFCVSVTSPATAGSYSVRLTDDNGSFGSSMYYVGDDNDVFVIANVAPSLSFNIRTLADDADTNVCDFGTVSPSDTLPNYDNVDDGASECGYSLAVGTNSASGFVVNEQADGPLRTAVTNLKSIDVGALFAPGVESYGYANITVASSGRNPLNGQFDQPLTKDSWWNVSNAATYIPVTSREQIFSYTNGIQYMAGAGANDVTQMIHGLVVGSGTPAGVYQQVLTYTVTANF